MKIRAFLFLMALATLTPVIAFSALALNMLLKSEHVTALKGLQEIARATALVVDRELLGAEAGLKVLATSPHLASGDLASFYLQARSADRGPGAATVLYDENGQQLINTALPFGAQLPPSVAREVVQRVLQSERTFASNVIPGLQAGSLVSTLNVPVVVSGTQRYVLAAVFESGFFEKRLKGQQTPPDWLIALIDQQGRFIARTHRNDVMIGKPARPELVEAAGRADVGQIRHKTWEGTEAYDAFTHSPMSNWTIAVAAPVDVIDGSARRAILVATLGLAVAIGCAGVAAVLFGGYLFRSINKAATSAVVMGNGHTPVAETSVVREVQQLHDAISHAARLISEERSARLQAEDERRQLMASEILARKRAEMENEAKDQFLAMLGHEIRNPLSAIHTAAALIGNAVKGNPTLTRARDILERQSQNLSKIVDDLLDVTRVSMGKVDLRLQTIDLAEVTLSCVEGLQAAQRTLGRVIRTDLQTTWVSADRTRVDQVINNLLINAIKYTPSGGTIMIVVRPQNDQATLSVQDSGIGISAHLLPNIFDLFVQAPATLDRTQGGLGIGLTLVRQLVTLHGGAVTAHSDGEGLGSIFTVTLPLSAEGPARPVAEPGDTMPVSRKVLLIEDNADGREMIAMALSSSGHQIFEAENGAQGIGIVAVEKPEVAVIDIGLPGMTGFDIARHFRSDPATREMRLIALTGYGQQSDRRAAIEAGFDEHLVKPVNMKDLLLSISREKT